MVKLSQIHIIDIQFKNLLANQKLLEQIKDFMLELKDFEEKGIKLKFGIDLVSAQMDVKLSTIWVKLTI